MRFLTHLLFALIVGSTLIGAAAWVSFRCARDPRYVKDPDKYWRWIGFAAEVCTALGVVGLITLAGRAYTDNHRHSLRQQTIAAEDRVRNALSEIDQRICLKRYSTPPMFKKGDGVEEKLCALVVQLARFYDPRTDWVSTSEDLAQLSAIDQVPRLHADLARDAVEAVQKMVAARRAEHAEHAHDDRTIPPIWWGVVLAIAIVACLGVGLKCSKALATAIHSH